MLYLALWALVAAQCQAIASERVEHQEVLQDTSKAQNEALKIRDELMKSEIIPTVIDPDFYPQILVNVTWPTDEEADLGNTLKPKKLQDTPKVALTDLLPHDMEEDSFKEHKVKYTIAMTDPDAPSRDDPKWSEFCHWIITNVKLSHVPDFDGLGKEDYDEVMPYKPPGPPPKTGKHRYVFIAFTPANLTTEPLHPSKPEERKHWGFDGEEETKGVREWADMNGLVPVGANFIYAQNKEQ